MLDPNTTPKLFALAMQEVAAFAGMTHMAIVTADALTTAVANTAQTLNLGVIPAGCYIYKAEFRLAKPFRDISDAAFNTTTASLGDSAAVNTFLTAKELNLNGTEILVPQLMNTPTGPYTADNHVDVTFNAMAAKLLSNIDEGELHILVQIFYPKALSDLKRLSPIGTK